MDRCMVGMRRSRRAALASSILMIATVSMIAPNGVQRVAAAEALSLGGAFDPVVPARLLDTRAGQVTVDGQDQAIGTRAAGSTTELVVTGRGGVPASAAAVALNVTATDAQAPGFVTVWPCGATQPTASNLNVAPGETVPNAVIAKVGTGGRVCLYTLTATELVVDVTGSFALGSSFTSLVPARLLDTRPGESTVDGQFAGGGAAAGGSTTVLTVAGRGGVAAGARAVALNVTVTGARAPGFVTVWPCDQARPTASNLNYRAGQTVPNAVIAELDELGRVCLFTLAGTDLVVDVNGAFTAGTAFRSLVPARLLDSRLGQPTVDGLFTGLGIRSAGSVTELPVTRRGGVGPDATAVALNVTVVEAGGHGFVTVWPCGRDRPTASSLNYAPGQTVPNAVIAQVGAGGAVCLYTHADVHLVVDVNGSVDTAWSMIATPAPGTVVVGGTDVIGLAGTSDTGGTVTLAAGSARPAAGGQLAVAPHPLAVAGMVGEVTAVAEQPDGSAIVTLVPTGLRDVFVTVRYHYAGPLDQAASPPASPARELDAVGCTGAVGLSPSIDVDFTGGALDLDVGVVDAHVLARIDGTVTVGVGVSASVEISCEVALPAVTFIIPFATIDLVPKLSVAVSGQLTASATLTVPFSVGLEATPLGGADNLTRIDPSGSGDTSTDVTATVTARAAIEPQLKFLGIAGGTLNLGVNLNINARPFEVPCGTITANGSAQFGLEIGRWGFDWSLTLATVNLPDVTLHEIRLSCPAAETAWVGTMSASVDMDRQTVTFNGASDTWENDYAWTATSTSTDVFTASADDVGVGWSNVLFFNRYTAPGVSWQCSHAGGGSLPSQFQARMYDTDFAPIRTPPGGSTVYISVTASYTGIPQTMTGDPIAGCAAEGSGPITVPQAGLALPPESDFQCLAGTVKSGGECLVVAQVSPDGRQIDVDVAMSGVYTTAGVYDNGVLKHRVNNTAQHVSIHLTLIDV